MAETENQEKSQEDEVNPLELSDEELMAAPPPTDSAPSEEGAEPPTEDEEEENDEYEEETQQENTEQENAEEAEEGDVAPATEAIDPHQDTKQLEHGKKKGGKKAKGKKEEGMQEEPGPTGSIDYQQEYERLLAPFKANGHMMQITGVDDALQLMQMGANYNKKMAGLKPNLKLMKMLEKNELLDEEKLSFLIDLQSKDPAAVAKFMQDADIDPMDVDVNEGDTYRPKTYNVDDKEVELDQVLEDIKDTPAFQETIDIISNKWDDSSKQILLENPTLIGVINEHVDSGIYNSIHDIIANERALGRLQGMSDIEAYKHVGDVIQANGGFNQQVEQPQPSAQEVQQTPPADTSKLKSRKRAASSTKSAKGQGGPKQDFNPLDLSDDEFDKLPAGMM